MRVDMSWSSFADHKRIVKQREAFDRRGNNILHNTLETDKTKTTNYLVAQKMPARSWRERITMLRAGGCSHRSFSTGAST